MRWVTTAAEPDRLSAVTTSAAFSSGVPAKITTGTRAASRSMKGEGTIPSPIKMPWASSVGEAGIIGALQEGDEQRPVMIADPRLDAAQHLVVEQQVHVLDVVLPRRALHADQADDVLAAAGQALGGTIGYVTELVDGLLHPDPGGIANPVLAVHHPRDRRGGNAGQVGDVVEGYHGFPISCIALSLEIPGLRAGHRAVI